MLQIVLMLDKVTVNVLQVKLPRTENRRKTEKEVLIILLILFMRISYIYWWS